MDHRQRTGLLVGAAIVASLASTSTATAGEQVTVTFTTSPTPYEEYAPRNVLAVWVENSSGAFVKTLVRFAQKRAQYLRQWNTMSLDRSTIDTQPDVITGATRSGHGQLTAIWDLTDYSGAAVADGDYVVRMELTDHNSSSMTQNNEGSLAVTIDGNSAQRAVADNGGFSGISVNYQADSTSTDPPGTDPPDPGCAGVTACIDGDGCCHPDCVYEVDDDCDPGTAQGEAAAAGCSTSGGAVGPISALLLLALWSLQARRHRLRR